MTVARRGDVVLFSYEPWTISGWWNSERRVPQQVVKTGRNPPGSERVKENAVWIGGLVGVVLVPEFPAVVFRIKQQGKFAS